jgi:hypothetical protein
MTQDLFVLDFLQAPLTLFFVRGQEGAARRCTRNLKPEVRISNLKPGAGEAWGDRRCGPEFPSRFAHESRGLSKSIWTMARHTFTRDQYAMNPKQGDGPSPSDPTAGRCHLSVWRFPHSLSSSKCQNLHPANADWMSNLQRKKGTLLHSQRYVTPG